MAERSSAQEFETAPGSTPSEAPLRWPSEAGAARGFGAGRARRLGVLAGVLCALGALLVWHLNKSPQPAPKAPAQLNAARKALQAEAADEPKPRVIMPRRAWVSDEAAPGVQPEPGAQPNAAAESKDALPSPGAAQPSDGARPAQEAGPAEDAADLDTEDGATATEILALRKQADKALGLRHLEQAEQLYWRVLELDVANPRAAFGLAKIRVKQGNLEAAEGLLRLAIRTRPLRASYHTLYAEVLQQLGRDDEALAERARAERGVQDK